MAYYNLPPVLSSFLDEIDKRLRKLENAYRFNAPNVNITTTPPAYPNAGDIYFDTHSNHLVYWNGTSWQQINDHNY